MGQSTFQRLRTSWRARATGAAVVAVLAGGAVAIPSIGNADTDPTATYTVKASSTAVKVGDTVDVTIKGADVSDLYGYDLTLTYDSSVLSYVAKSATTDITGSTFEKASDGTVDVIHTKLGTSPAAKGDVTLATATFTAVGTGDVTVSASKLVSVTAADDTSTSDDLGDAEVTVSKHDAATATTAPSVSGTAKITKTLTADPGAWDTEGLAYGYQWLRSGTPINGATGKTYTVKTLDAGKKLSVKVTATKDGYEDATATSEATATVPTVTTRTTQVVSPKTLKAGKALTVKVTVSATGITPQGTVYVYYRGHLTRSKVALKAGKVTLTFHPTAKGKHTLSVYFHPGTGFAASHASTSVTVK